MLVITAVLVIALAVTGTLMFFTATTETATNVVTIGGLNVVLEESDDDGLTYQLIGPNGISGLNYADAAPGDVLKKRPRINNKGKLGIYAYMELEIKVMDTTDPSNPVQVTITEQTNGVAGAAMAHYFDYDQFKSAGVVDPVKVGLYWQNSVIAPIVADAAANGWYAIPASRYHYSPSGSVVVGFFYADATTGLTEVGATTETTPLFDDYTVPTDLPDSFAGHNVELLLKGYAVSSASNTLGVLNPADTTAELKTDRFALAFDGLQIFRP
jgi:hypothetical protein